MRLASDSPLRHRDFALFWVAMASTGFAMSMASVAIGWQVYSVRESPLDLGLIGLAEFLPLLLFALPAGHVADRFPRRRVYALMVVSDVVVFLALLGVTLQGATTVWPFFVLAFLTGTGSAFGAPAGRALTPSLVPQEILVSALAQRSIRSPVAGVVTDRLLSPGEFVKGTAILKLAQIHPLRVEVIAPVALLGKIAVGMRAEVQPEAPVSGSYPAIVTVVDRVVDAASGTFGVRLELPNPNYRLPAGLKCKVRFGR